MEKMNNGRMRETSNGETNGSCLILTAERSMTRHRRSIRQIVGGLP